MVRVCNLPTHVAPSLTSCLAVTILSICSRFCSAFRSTREVLSIVDSQDTVEGCDVGAVSDDEHAARLRGRPLINNLLHSLRKRHPVDRKGASSPSRCRM